MKTVPFHMGSVHFIGIGGIGMSGIAEVMHNQGYAVQGSDLSHNANVQRLETMGIKIQTGHDPDNLGAASVVVVSSAVGGENPELVAARERGIPVVPRAEMLAELMRLKWCVSVAGTHGKTTTTSMIAAVLEAARYDPTVINGGIINAYGTNARLGEGDWMVVEADESDGTFIKLPSTLAIVTNLDPEHLDFYGDFDAEKRAFQTFLERVPFYGAAILCIDHADVQALIPGIRDRRVITYGFSPQAMVRAEALRFKGGGCEFNVAINLEPLGAEQQIDAIYLPMPGRHNVQNALAAISVGLQMGLDGAVLKRALAGFEGVKRRFTRTGEALGAAVIDDYGHHPVEIAAVLNAARESYEGRIIAIVQPHRFSRLEHLFEDFCTCFNDADTVVVAPVFPAGEEQGDRRGHRDLAAGLRDYGHRSVSVIEGEDDLAPLLAPTLGPGDVIVCLGAGNITRWANELPTKLAAAAEGQPQ